MTFTELKGRIDTKDFVVFNKAEYIGAICAPACANYTRKELDGLTDFVKKPQIGAQGLVYVKYNEDGSIKSSVDKFYTQEELLIWMELTGAKSGDLVLVLVGEKGHTQRALCELRLEMGRRLGLMDKNV